MDIPSKKNDRGVQIKWIENMDALLIDSLLHQQQIGNRINGQGTTSFYDSWSRNSVKSSSFHYFRKSTCRIAKRLLNFYFHDAHDLICLRIPVALDRILRASYF